MSPLSIKGISEISLQPINWMDALLIVLLGIGSTLKEDIHCTAAELVYGTTLRLPGEFFNSDSQATTADPTNYVHRLRTTMQQLRAPPVHPSQRQTRIPDTLHTCTHVFVCHDAIQKPLQHPYDGPYKVLYCSDKHFTLNIQGTRKTVSLDRLKPTHLEYTTTVQDTPQPSTITSTTPHTPHPTYGLPSNLNNTFRITLAHSLVRESVY